ncbi:MAG: radical SAM family heme chaperone HemW [Acidimicrobiales bacterium]
MGFGVYVHVPFCRARCDYCAFATWTDRDQLIEQYLAACRREVEQAADQLPAVTSIFVGGGTPSRVPAGLLLDVLRVVPHVDGAEVTVECNPDDVTPELLESYRLGGVNRVSFGVQSMVPAVLASLGRTHRPENVVAAACAARAVGLAFNIDLIYGAAGESQAEWAATLEAALDLRPDHVSAYALTVEPGTPLATDRARHPDDDDQADKYLLADALLSAAGLDWYEISNWARPGHRCRHNLLYWTQGEYLGIGCAAHSHRGGRRWWNVRTPERYVAAIEASRSAEAGGEHLDHAGRRLEQHQLAVRTSEGVPASAFDAAALDELEGLVNVAGDRAHLTVAGRLLANEVAIRLSPAAPVAPGVPAGRRPGPDR